MNKILYFPYISVPKTPWLASALLYWDRIGSIVPYEYTENPSQLTPYMRELVIAGLVEQIFPEDHLHKVPRFQESFLNFIDKSGRAEYFRTKNRDWFNPGTGTTDSLSNSFQLHEDKLAGRRPVRVSRISGRCSWPKEKRATSAPIHTGKLEGLAAGLEERGLARIVNPPWIEVEGYTAYHFMAYLASILGKVTGYQPATDGYNGLADLTDNPRRPRHTSQIRDELRAQVLTDILPSPMEIQDISELVRFKERHGRQLVRFRKHVEDFLSRLETAGAEHSREMIKSFRADNRDQIEDITARMREQRWKFIGLTTLCSVGSALIPLTKAVAQNQKGALWEAIPGLVAAIGSALSSRQVSSLRRHPLAYAIMARQFIYKNSTKARVLDPFAG
jgi:hypothetical protein